jgi:hypothetical protein
MNETTTTTDTRTTSTRTNRRIGRIVAACSLAVVLGGLAVGCADDTKDAVSTDTLTGALSVTTSTTTADGGSTGGSTSGGSSSGGSSSGGSSSGGGSSTVKPVINSFTTPENIDCHNGNLQNFTAKWSTTNATKVTISIDGPGIYDTYGPSGETSLPFNCTSSHTFLLTAYSADGTTSTQQITLQPRNVQSQTPDTEA